MATATAPSPTPPHAPPPGTGAGARWEAQRREQEEAAAKARDAERSRAQAALGAMLRDSEATRIENIKRELNAAACETWLRYLRDPGLAAKKKTCSKAAPAFDEARRQAAALIDPLLKSRRIYDDSRAVTEDLEGASGSQGKEALVRELLRHYGLHDASRPEHWFAKGMLLHQNPEIPIRCDGSAALAFYDLVMADVFKASIGLVQQGDPGMSGHWFLVAGAKEDLLDGNINPFPTAAAAAPKMSWCFVIDLWGAKFQKVSTTVWYPARCIAGNWPHRIIWIL